MNDRLHTILARIAAAAEGRPVDLLAVSKTRSSEEVRALPACGQRAFGENYVQEAVPKQAALRDLALDWHLIGPLQSNKCREAAATFDWVETVDRPKLVPLLARYRDASAPPLNLLVQVNIDDEASKSGCRPEQIEALAASIAAEPRLRLRGLMAIPAPGDAERLRRAFRSMAAWFERLRGAHPAVDTLSMGMSDDFELAVAEGSTEVRIGTALFGPRPPKPATD